MAQIVDIAPAISIGECLVVYIIKTNSIIATQNAINRFEVK